MQQADLQLSLSFDGGCDVDLVAGYTDYQTDTYYPTVVNADDAHRMGLTGEGVTVAVIDSGIWSEHAGIAKDTQGQDRIIATYDATTGTRGVATDERGHGTHISSILANSERVEASAAGTSYKGIAPGVNLVSVKAFNQAEEGSYFDVLRAIQFVLDNREELNIKVLNLSVGAEATGPYWEDPVNQLVMEAWRQGIFVVVSSGNQGEESINAPGNNPYVMTVGAVTDSYTPFIKSDDQLVSFSSRGLTEDGFAKPEVVAPGGHMIGVAAANSGLAQENPQWVLPGDQLMMSGTSQATAIVSGIAALMLENEPGLTPNDLKCRITQSASTHVAGAAYVDAMAAHR